MFYCDQCRQKAEWPTSFMTSHGPCEMCHQITSCYDVPSRALPEPKKVARKKKAPPSPESEPMTVWTRLMKPDEEDSKP